MAALSVLQATLSLFAQQDFSVFSPLFPQEIINVVRATTIMKYFFIVLNLNIDERKTLSYWLISFAHLNPRLAIQKFPLRLPRYENLKNAA